MIDLKPARTRLRWARKSRCAVFIVESGSDTLVYTAKNGLLYTLAMNTSRSIWTTRQSPSTR